jgi:histone H3/H4
MSTFGLKSRTYGAIQSAVVKKITEDVKSTKKHRNLDGRVFPKGSLNRLSLNYGARRIASSGKKDAYKIINRELVNVLTQILTDAVHLTEARGKCIISSNDIMKSITMNGGSTFGLATDKVKRKGKILL